MGLVRGSIPVPEAGADGHLGGVSLAFLCLRMPPGKDLQQAGRDGQQWEGRMRLRGLGAVCTQDSAASHRAQAWISPLVCLLLKS